MLFYFRSRFLQRFGRRNPSWGIPAKSACQAWGRLDNLLFQRAADRAKQNNPATLAMIPPMMMRFIPDRRYGVLPPATIAAWVERRLAAME